MLWKTYQDMAMVGTVTGQYLYAHSNLIRQSFKQIRYKICTGLVPGISLLWGERQVGAGASHIANMELRVHIPGGPTQKAKL